MWFILLFSGIFASFSMADIISSSYFCADMNPQPHVIIDQLMGIWYGIEIIYHKDEHHYVQKVPSCPIIYLSEDTYTTTYNPLYRDYNYGYNYGEGHGYNNRRTHYGRTQQENRRQQEEYDRSTTYKTNYNRRYGQNDYVRRQNEDYKRLKLSWDENGITVDYHMRYNLSRAGFWISSGPQNGSALDPQFSHFAGTVQVIKAVGNHLVLTFCHQLPDKQLFSVLLSRENKLDNVEVHGVHNLLNRKGLSTNAVKKVCNGSIKRYFSHTLLLSVVLFFTYNISR